MQADGKTCKGKCFCVICVISICKRELNNYIYIKLKLTIFPKTENNPCKRNNGGCHHTCRYKAGVKACSCRTGFSLQSDGKTCKGEQTSSFSF